MGVGVAVGRGVGVGRGVEVLVVLEDAVGDGAGRVFCGGATVFPAPDDVGGATGVNVGWVVAAGALVALGAVVDVGTRGTGVGVGVARRVRGVLRVTLPGVAVTLCPRGLAGVGRAVWCGVGVAVACGRRCELCRGVAVGVGGGVTVA